MKNRLLLIVSCILTINHTAFAQNFDPQNLKKDLELTVAPYMAKVGIALMDIEDKSTVLVNNNHRYPMQSVYKFPLAIYILDKVDKGELSLTKNVHVRQEQLRTDTWSPLAKKFAGRDINVTVAELLNYAVSKSDNNACDILFELAGGTRYVHQYFQGLNIKDMVISATEAEMHSSWPVQYNNWCQPSAMLEILRLFYEGRLLSENNTKYLMRLMVKSENSTKRIMGKLPAGTIVAHKTGTSVANEKGITAATNDVGIITLPNGHHLAIVVYVSDYTGGYEQGEQIIASVAKCAWDHYTGKINTIK